MSPPRVRAAAAAAIAAAVEQLPEVSQLSSGPAGTIATYLPGDRVVGVRLRNNRAEVHVVAASMTTPLVQVAIRVRSAAEPHVPHDCEVDVYIDDIDDSREAYDGHADAEPLVVDTEVEPERGVWGGPERQPILGTEPVSLPRARPESSVEVPL